jgi:LysM repeat protein
MKSLNIPKTRIIVPLFLLSGLLPFITGCGSTQAKPDNTEEPVVTAEETEAPVKQIRVKAEHPRQYTVKKGDTLWGISSMFLQDPWYWPEIWSKNQQVKNPHLIYPGDVLTLVYVNGQPQIQVISPVQPRNTQQTSEASSPVKKLSPGIRVSPLDASIPTIPSDAIRQFLTKPRVITKKQMEDAPRIIGSEERHLVLGTGNRVYIRGELDKERVRYSVFNPGKALRDPETYELLGYEAKYAGEVRITNYGDPASADLVFTEREVLIGDRLLIEDKSKVENLFFPRVPKGDVRAEIISLYEALSGVAQFQIVVLNKGEVDGMEVGYLLATYSNGVKVRDYLDKFSSKLVKLPDERTGLVMIFETFERVSYAIVLESRRVIKNHDLLLPPKY